MIRKGKETRGNYRRPFSEYWSRVLFAILILFESPLGSCSRSDARPDIRPAPSLDLPIIDLIEPKGEMYDPKPENTDPVVLRQKLGDGFDPKFMSEERPEDSAAHPNGTFSYSLRENKHGHKLPPGQMPRDLKQLRLNHVRMQDGERVPLRLSRKMRRRFKELLWLVTYCPVLHRWKDLGPRFWPRWIREGVCVQTSTKMPTACSIPGGMVCKPHRFEEKVILRWHCQDWSHKSPCEWMSVLYPVITECRCSC